MRGFIARAGLLLGDLLTSFGLGGKARPPAAQPDVLRLVARSRPAATLRSGVVPATVFAAYEPPTARVACVVPEGALSERARPTALLH